METHTHNTHTQSRIPGMLAAIVIRARAQPLSTIVVTHTHTHTLTSKRSESKNAMKTKDDERQVYERGSNEHLPEVNGIHSVTSVWSRKGEGSVAPGVCEYMAVC